jgi:hypothetical protein
MPIPLRESETVVLDGSGNGTARMRPDGSQEYWLPTGASVKVSSNINEAECIIYIGPSPTDPYVVDGTFTGSFTNSTDRVAGYTIGSHADPYIWAVWSGGDPGAQATLRVIGTKEIR